MEFVKVVIVGGGVAGLGAAKTLGSSIDYLIIEAADYAGGRIRTIDAVPDVFVDLGAQFIHGQTNNIVYEICEKLNCLLIEKEKTEQNMLVIGSDRRIIDSKLMNQAIDIWETILFESRSKFAEKETAAKISLSDFIDEHFKERLRTSFPSESKLIDALIEYFQNSELIENGCENLSDLSLAEYGSFEYLEGSYDVQFQNGGYRPFISYLKSFIPNENRIRFNSEVIRVKYLSEERRLSIDIRSLTKNDNEQEQRVTTIQCEHLIWTSSLGYLKEHFHSIFESEPQLIREKQNAITNLGFDTVNKVVLVYQKSFWPKDIQTIILLHTESSAEFDDFQWISNTEIDRRTLKTIVNGIHRFDVLPSTDVPVLICWFGGEAAILIEQIPESILGQLCHRVLCYYLNISLNSVELIRSLRSEWHKNRFTRGSYTYYSTRSSSMDGESLRRPYSPDGIARIQFAGEATHQRFYSTVHGALESGIREGQFLLSILEK